MKMKLLLASILALTAAVQSRHLEYRKVAGIKIFRVEETRVGSYGSQVQSRPATDYYNRAHRPQSSHPQQKSQIPKKPTKHRSTKKPKCTKILNPWLRTKPCKPM